MSVVFSFTSAVAGELTKRGKVLIEGGLSYPSSSGEQTFVFFGEDVDVDLPERTHFSVIATVGGFLTDGFFLGGRVGFDSQTVTSESEDGDAESSVTALSFGAVPRYYIALSDSKELFIKLGGLLAYTSVSSEDDDGFESFETSASGFSFGLEAGLVVALGERQGGYIDIGLALTFQSLSGDDDGAESEFDLSQTIFGLQVGLGAFL